MLAAQTEPVRSDDSGQYLPVQNLEAKVEGRNVKLNWDAPASGNLIPIDEGFDDDQVPAGWLNVDSDGDGFVWHFQPQYYGFDGEGKAIASRSYIGNTALTPDNWLITKKFVVPETDAELSFNIGLLLSQTDETYSVLLSETTSDISAFTTVLIKESLKNPIRQDKGVTANSQEQRASWKSRVIDLKPYAGKEVYLAFRHFESTDNFGVCLDNVKVKGVDTNPTTDFKYNIYRDTELIKTVSDNSYVDIDVEFGSHTYELEVVYNDGGLSPKKSVDVIVYDPTKFAYIYLEAHNVWTDGTGYQVYLDQTGTQYGNAMPSIGSPFTQDCDIPEDLASYFTHFVPVDADIACDAQNIIVDNVVRVAIPIGLYDLCVVNPTPGVKIYYVGGFNSVHDDIPIEEGKHYFLRCQKKFDPITGAPDGDTVVSGIFDELPQELFEYFPVFDIEGNVVGDHVQLSWVEPQYAREKYGRKDWSYNIYRNKELIANVSDEHFSETGISAGTHTYELEVKYSGGTSPKVPIKLNVITSIDEVIANLKVYGSEACVVIDTNQEVEASLFDIQGRLISKQRTIGATQMAAKAGIYVLRLRFAGEEVYVQKVRVR